MTYGNSSTGTLTKFSPQPLTTGGRPIKFTPERLQQIRNLVERGTSRQEIAEILDVTVGSLQVTCSKVGISLRRPKLDNGVRLLQQRNSTSRKSTIIMQPDNHDGSVPSQPTEEQSQGNSQSEPAEPALAAKPQQERVKALEAGSANVAIRIQYNGMERITELPLALDIIGQLAWEAEFRDMRFGELIAELIVAMVKKNLFPVALGEL
jgi:transcriptional regulator